MPVTQLLPWTSHFYLPVQPQPFHLPILGNPSKPGDATLRTRLGSPTRKLSQALRFPGPVPSGPAAALLLREPRPRSAGPLGPLRAALRPCASLGPSAPALAPLPHPGPFFLLSFSEIRPSFFLHSLAVQGAGPVRPVTQFSQHPAGPAPCPSAQTPERPALVSAERFHCGARARPQVHEAPDETTPGAVALILCF